MNHQQRITKLERQVNELQQQVSSLTNQDEWLSLTEAHKRFLIGKDVLRRRIYSGVLKRGKDWRFNGNRYLVKASAIQKLIVGELN